MELINKVNLFFIFFYFVVVNNNLFSQTCSQEIIFQNIKVEFFFDDNNYPSSILFNDSFLGGSFCELTFQNSKVKLYVDERCDSNYYHEMIERYDSEKVKNRFLKEFREKNRLVINSTQSNLDLIFQYVSAEKKGIFYKSTIPFSYCCIMIEINEEVLKNSKFSFSLERIERLLNQMNCVYLK